MTREQLDSSTFNGSIANGATETFEVNTSRASNVIILIDDGTTDTEPAQYDLTQRIYSPPQDAYQFYDSVTASTARAFTDPAWGSKMEVEITNTSGTSGNYRISIISYRDLD